MDKKVWTINEIRSEVEPVAEKYNLAKVFLFGSYARGNATPKSDIDLCVEEQGKKLSLFGLSALYLDFYDRFGNELDLITRTSIEGDTRFKQNIEKEWVQIYG